MGGDLLGMNPLRAAPTFPVFVWLMNCNEQLDTYVFVELLVAVTVSCMIISIVSFLVLLIAARVSCTHV